MASTIQNGMSLRILMASTNGIKRDGITSWITGIFSHMDKKGLDIDVIAYDNADGQIVEEVESAGVCVRRLPSRKGNPRAYRTSFRDLLRRRHYDVVHVCGNSATTALELLSARREGVRMRIVHSRNTTCTHRVADRLLRPIMYACATDYYACGIAAGEWLFHGRDFTVIPNGKDLTAYGFDTSLRADARRVLSLEDGEIAIGHVGNFTKQKNHRFLLDVMGRLCREHPHVRCFLIGDGDLRGEMEERVGNAGLSGSIAFLGHRSDVPLLLQGMDCMALPSLYEGYPNVVVEWQLAGLPCVISDSITRECAFSDLVHFLPLGAGEAAWAHQLARAPQGSERQGNATRAMTSAKLAGLDIVDDAAMLRDLYLRGASR